jgi:hypothetical protein
MGIRLIHITPELPPAVGGVADYTTILNQRLVEVSDGALEPVMVHAGKAPAETIEVDFPVADLSGAQSAAILANTIRELTDATDGRTVVLLEYSGYGYAARGAPMWLASGLKQVCGENGVPLLTMFHEISASSWKPWTSTFWLSPLQSWVARRIAQCSVGLMTTHPTGAETLRQFVDQDTPVDVCPVFSNVGEPEERPTFEVRAPQAVIFGGSRTKTALYDTHRDATETVLRNWDIDTVIDVGPSDAVAPDALSMSVDIRGLQPAHTISKLLLGARIGLLHYPAAYATKSGILAAYMAHGVVPVLVAPKPFGGRLEAGTHFASSSDNSDDVDLSAGSNIGRVAIDWYDRHAHSRHAATTLLSLIEQTTTSAV